MDSLQIANAAYVNSQVACAMIEAMGMQAENQNRERRGESIAYTEKSFNDLILKYGIGHNDVVVPLFRSN